MMSVQFKVFYLLQAIQSKRLAHAIKESTLDRLITELLLWLLDETVPWIWMMAGKQWKFWTYWFWKFWSSLFHKASIWHYSCCSDIYLAYLFPMQDNAERTHHSLSWLISCIHWTPVGGHHQHQMSRRPLEIRSSLIWLSNVWSNSRKLVSCLMFFHCFVFLPLSWWIFYIYTS